MILKNDSEWSEKSNSIAGFVETQKVKKPIYMMVKLVSQCKLRKNKRTITVVIMIREINFIEFLHFELL